LRDQHKKTSAAYDKTKASYSKEVERGLLLKIQALFLLGERDNTIWWSLRLFIMMIFLIETAPILVKLMSQRGAYEAKIEEIDYMKKIQSDEKVERVKCEIRKKMYKEGEYL